MKRKILTGLAALTVIIVMSSYALMSYTTKKIADNLWQQLGIPETSGRNNIKESFLSGALRYYGVRNFKNITLNNRAAIATDLLNYTKKYVSTPEFNKEYLKFRQDMKPYPPDAPKTKEGIREGYIKELETQLQNMQKLLPTTKDEIVKKFFTERIPQLKKEIEDLKLPNNPRVENAWQAEQNRIKWANEAYQKKVKEWETEFPESYVQLIKNRLEQFLDKTKDMDYNAELTERQGKKRFTNPVYEGKDYQWKMAFRAGKEVTETARIFAQQWLKELN